MFFAYYAVNYLYLYPFLFTYLTVISVIILYFVLIILTELSLGLAFSYMQLTYLFFTLDYFYIQWMNPCIWIFWNAIKFEGEAEVEGYTMLTYIKLLQRFESV
jgi:hypothetical protein